jgi:hypothetical protein
VRFVAALLILGIVAAAAFWLGRGRRAGYWSLAAAALYLVGVPVSRRAFFDAVPSEVAGNAAYAAGEISYNEADRIAAADRRAAIESMLVAGVATLLLFGVARIWMGRPEGSEAASTADDEEQLAGGECASCGGRIVATIDAELCKRCRKPVHGSCRAAHQATCGATGYRGATKDG